MVTPGAIWMLEEAAPDVVVLSVVADPVPVVEEEPVAVDVSDDEFTAVPVPALVVPVPVVPVFEVPVLDSAPEVPPVDVESVVVESALATPGEVAIITPIPNAAANAPSNAQ